MDQLIQPRLLKGFRDALPKEESLRKELISILEKVFMSFGFMPIDTPALEYSEILLGKGGGETEKQIYRFNDDGGRDIALRYDLTVPFARFMSAHSSELYLPFKRYHIAKVWRGEKPQKGRYREFFQCDFDIVGIDSSSSDFEILLLMAKSLKKLGLNKFRIHFSHRGILSKLMKVLGLQNKSTDTLRAIDKLQKIGREKVEKILSEYAGPEQIKQIIDFITPADSFTGTLSKITDLIQGEDENIIRLKEIKAFIDELGLSDFFYLDPSITRGLDYYTGIVFETYLTDLPNIGSVCSGGRYNNLTSLYTKEIMPGVGSSIGLDRLLAAMNELGLKKESSFNNNLLILCMDESYIGYYNKLAEEFRNEGINTEVFLQKKKMGKQFNFAEKKNYSFACICGEDEKKRNEVIIKDLTNRNSYEGLNIKAAINKIKELRKS